MITTCKTFCTEIIFVYDKNTTIFQTIMIVLKWNLKLSQASNHTTHRDAKINIVPTCHCFISDTVVIILSYVSRGLWHMLLSVAQHRVCGNLLYSESKGLTNWKYKDGDECDVNNNIIMIKTIFVDELCGSLIIMFSLEFMLLVKLYTFIMCRLSRILVLSECSQVRSAYVILINT